MFLAFLFAGMASVGIPVYAASWPIFALYAAGILGPFFYVLLTFGNRLFVEIALLVPLFYAINVAIAYRLTHVFESGYRLRRAYGKLTEEHTMLNQRLQRQLVELEEARRQVEASGRKLALFAERAPIAVLELRPDGTVSEVNQAAELLFGYAAAELVGGSVKKLVRLEFHAEFDRTWQELLAKRESMAGLKIRNPRRDGIDLICEWTVTPLVNPDHEVIAVIAQGRDVTAQLEAERMKKEFTSTLSHELRTPLTSIIGSLQLINSGVMGEGRTRDRRAHRGCRAQRPAPARPDQRHPRHRENRIRQACPRAGADSGGRAGARGDGAQQGLRRALQGALRMARRRCPSARSSPTASACCRS